MFNQNDLVEILFDTGCMGANILYGKIVRATGKEVHILWENGNRNRLRYSYGTKGVVLAHNQQLAAEMMEKSA